MRILFLGLNYLPEEIGIGIYSGGLCGALAAAGHDVTAVVAKPYYPQWRVWPAFVGGGRRRCREGGVDVIRLPLYVPRRPSGARRLLHHISFAGVSLPTMLAQARVKRPDLIITVAPSMIAAPVAALAAKVAGARSWLHVQDFEVGAAMATGLLDEGVVSRLAMRFERWTVRCFDRVSSISDEMCARLITLNVPPERVSKLPNWSDVDAIRPLDRPSFYRDEWGITTPYVALYSGNIALKQGIGIITAAARRLAHRTDLTFVICGEGPSRAALEADVGALPNVQLRDLQPRERLSELLGLATVHLLPQRADAADLVLPSKLVNMLASGRPIVATASPGTGLFKAVSDAGILVPPEDDVAFADAIVLLLNDPARLRDLGAQARRKAQYEWARQPILEKLVDDIEHL